MMDGSSHASATVGLLGLSLTDCLKVSTYPPLPPPLTPTPTTRPSCAFTAHLLDLYLQSRATPEHIAAGLKLHQGK